MLWIKGLTHLGIWGDVTIFEPYVLEVVEDEYNQLCGFVLKSEKEFRLGNSVYKVVAELNGISSKSELKQELEQTLVSIVDLKPNRVH